MSSKPSSSWSRNPIISSSSSSSYYEIERLLKSVSKSNSDRDSLPEEGSQSTTSDARSSGSVNSRRRRRRSVDRRSSESSSEEDSRDWEDDERRKKKLRTFGVKLELKLKAEIAAMREERLKREKERIEHKRIVQEEWNKFLSRMEGEEIDSKVDSELPESVLVQLSTMKYTLLLKLYSRNGSLTPKEENLREKVTKDVVKKR